MSYILSALKENTDLKKVFKEITVFKDKEKKYIYLGYPGEKKFTRTQVVNWIRKELKVESKEIIIPPGFYFIDES